MLDFLRKMRRAYQLMKAEDKIAEIVIRVGVIEDMTAVQCSDGNWDYAPYMHGMANGMIFCLATIKGESPEYLSAPEEWGIDKHGERVTNG